MKYNRLINKAINIDGKSMDGCNRISEINPDQ